MRDRRFSFTITDAARFLGKSPVTLRKWERQGIVNYPRLDGTGDRRFTLDDLEQLVDLAERLGRISTDRAKLIRATLTLLGFVEHEDCNPRST